MFRVIAWASLALYLLIVGLYPAAAAPVGLAASGALTVVAQPAVLLVALLTAVVASGRRRPAPAPARRH